jgi:hypothetical protein
MSDLDISAGERWTSALAREIERSRFAVIIVTADTANAPWILFEAGALSRLFHTAKVVPYLVDIQPNDLRGPLSQFQARRCDRDSTLDLVLRIDAVSPSPAGPAEIARRFRKNWSSFSRHLLRVTPRVSMASSITHETQAAQVLRFESAVHFELYLAQAIDHAQREICDLTWKDAISGSHDVKARRSSLRQYELSIAKAGNRIAYREIFIFKDKRRIEKLLRRLKEGRPGYSCRYFKVADAHIPRLQFLLIDGTEIAFGPASASAAGLIVRNTELCNILHSYFDEAWHHALPIKDGLQVHQATVEKILASDS